MTIWFWMLSPLCDIHQNQFEFTLFLHATKKNCFFDRHAFSRIKLQILLCSLLDKVFWESHSLLRNSCAEFSREICNLMHFHTGHFYVLLLQEEKRSFFFFLLYCTFKIVKKKPYRLPPYVLVTSQESHFWAQHACLATNAHLRRNCCKAHTNDLDWNHTHST